MTTHRRNVLITVTLLVVFSLVLTIHGLLKGKAAPFSELVQGSEIAVIGSVKEQSVFAFTRQSGTVSVGFGWLVVDSCLWGPFERTNLIPVQRIVRGEDLRKNGMFPSQQSLWLLTNDYPSNITGEVCLELGFPIRSSNYFGSDYPVDDGKEYLKVIAEKPLGLTLKEMPYTANSPVLVHLFARNGTTEPMLMPYFGYKNDSFECDPRVNISVNVISKHYTETPIIKTKRMPDHSPLVIGTAKEYSTTFDLRSVVNLVSDVSYLVKWEVDGRGESNSVIIFITDQVNFSTSVRKRSHFNSREEDAPEN